MTSLATGSLSIPKQKLEPWLGKIKNGSAVASLSTPTPMTFGEGESWTFDIGEAEYVAEGARRVPPPSPRRPRASSRSSSTRPSASTKRFCGLTRTVSSRSWARSWI